MVAAGAFQEDLYYRLSVIPIELPPLRERPRGHPRPRRRTSSTNISASGKAPVERVTDEALEALSVYEWPGNVRELENCIERAVVLSRPPVLGLAEISLPSVGATRRDGLPSLDLRHNVDWVERETVRLALERAKGVKKLAAALMGISQRAMSYYLKKFGLG